MYLGAVYLSLDLEPEVTSSDRERLLRSLRDKIRQAYGQKITIRSNTSESLAIALFDDNYARIKSRCSEIIEKIESFGEARIDLSDIQIFCWFDGSFKETQDNDLNLTTSDSDKESYFAQKNLHNSNKTNGATIKYKDIDSDEDSGPKPIPSRFTKKYSKYFAKN